MATYSFKEYGTFSREYEIEADTESEARKVFRVMSDSDREDSLVFDDYDVEYSEVEEVDTND